MKKRPSLGAWRVGVFSFLSGRLSDTSGSFAPDKLEFTPSKHVFARGKTVNTISVQGDSFALMLYLLCRSRKQKLNLFLYTKMGSHCKAVYKNTVRLRQPAMVVLFLQDSL